MKETEEIQDGMFVMRWRSFIPLMAAIVIGTNTVSIFYQKQQQNTEAIEYNKERADRIAKRHLEDAKYYFEMEQIKKELEYCKNERSKANR